MTGRRIGLDLALKQVAERLSHDPENPVVRLYVRQRAWNVCEYCLARTEDAFHVDHIIPRSRWEDYIAGQIPGLAHEPNRNRLNSIQNFAWACPRCNQKKLGQVTYDLQGEAVPLYDPRKNIWGREFVFVHNYLYILGRTKVGEATANALGFNVEGIGNAVGCRHDRIVNGRYPPRWAREYLLFPDE